jgi:hypothetical protein
MAKRATKGETTRTEKGEMDVKQLLRSAKPGDYVRRQSWSEDTPSIKWEEDAMLSVGDISHNDWIVEEQIRKDGRVVEDGRYCVVSPGKVKGNGKRTQQEWEALLVGKVVNVCDSCGRIVAVGDDTFPLEQFLNDLPNLKWTWIAPEKLQWQALKDEAKRLANEGKLDEFNRFVQKQSELTDFTREQKEQLDNLQRLASSHYMAQKRHSSRKNPLDLLRPHKSDANLDSTTSAD